MVRPLKLFGTQRKKKNDGQLFKGFTLLECVISLMVLTLIIQSFSWFLQIERQSVRSKGRSSSLEWHLFATNLDNASENWRFIKMENELIWFKDSQEREGDNLFFIEQVNYQLRKRKHNGVELLLENVEAVWYSTSETKIRMEVTFTDGKKYRGDFPQWIEK